MVRRIERVNVLLRQEISTILSNELNDPRLSSMVTVTSVEAARDLHSARVFVSVLGRPDQKRDTLVALKDASGFVRKRLRRSVTLRSVPTLEFTLDESIERGVEMLKLIDEVTPSPLIEGES